MHVLSGDSFVGKTFLAQLCGVGCRQEKAQEPLVGGGRRWEATEGVNTHPPGCVWGLALNTRHPRAPPQGTWAPRGALLAEEEVVEEEAFLLGCCPWERASWGCCGAGLQAEGRRAAGCPGLRRSKGPLLEGRLLCVTELPLAPGPSQKGFNRASPDPFLPLGVGRPGGRAGAGLPACSQLVVSQGS